MGNIKLHRFLSWFLLTGLSISACVTGQQNGGVATQRVEYQPTITEMPTAANVTPSPEDNAGSITEETPETPEAAVTLPTGLQVINEQNADRIQELAVILPYFPDYYLISDDGRVGAIGGLDGIDILDMDSGSLLSHIPVQLRDCAYGMDRYFRFNQDATFAALAAEGLIQVWQVGGGVIYEASYDYQSDSEIGICGAETPQLALSPDGRFLAVSGVESYRQYFKVLDVLENRVVYAWDSKSDDLLHGNLYNYDGLGFSNDGAILQTFDPTRFFALSGSAHEAFRFWSVDDWQELDRNSAEVRNGFSEADLLFALQNDDAILIEDRITGQIRNQLAGTNCSLDYPCGVKLSPNGGMAVILDYRTDPIQYHSDVLATSLEIWDVKEQAVVNQAEVLLRDLDGVLVSDDGTYRFVSENMIEMPLANSWWTSGYNFSGLTLAQDERVLFSPVRITSSIDNSSYYGGICGLDLDDLSVTCEEKFYSVEGNAYALAAQDGLIVLKPVGDAGPSNAVELALPADFDEDWSVRFLGYSEEYETMFFCLDENRRSQNCLVYNAADEKTLADVEDIYSLRFSPDGSFAVYIDREEKALFLVDLESAKVKKIGAYQSRAWLVNPSFASEGSELVYMIQNLSDENLLSLEWVDADGGDILRRVNLDVMEDVEPDVLSWQSGSGLIALGGDNGWIYILEQNKGKVLYSWQAHADSVIGMTFAAKGKLLVSLGTDGRIRIWGISK